MSNTVSTKTLNILKAALPFVPSSMQKNLSYFVKIEEFNNMFNNFSESIDSTLSACELNENDNTTAFNMSDFIYAIRPYLDQKEYDTITNFMNFFNAYNIYQSISSISGNNSSLLNLIQSLNGNNTSNKKTNDNLTNMNRNMNQNAVPGNLSGISNLINSLNFANSNSFGYTNSGNMNSGNMNSANHSFPNSADFFRNNNTAGNTGIKVSDEQNPTQYHSDSKTEFDMLDSSIEALNSLINPNIIQNSTQNN